MTPPPNLLKLPPVAADKGVTTFCSALALLRGGNLFQPNSVSNACQQMRAISARRSG